MLIYVIYEKMAEMPSIFPEEPDVLFHTFVAVKSVVSTGFSQPTPSCDSVSDFCSGEVLEANVPQTSEAGQSPVKMRQATVLVLFCRVHYS